MEWTFSWTGWSIRRARTEHDAPSPPPDDSAPGKAMSLDAMTTFSLLPMIVPKSNETLVDTSAVYAVLDANNDIHTQARTL